MNDDGDRHDHTASRDEDLPVIERQKDVLLRLAARRAAGALDPGDAPNARFFDWYARESRDRERVWERRLTSERAQAFVERVQARVAARRARLLVVHEAPTTCAARASGPLVQVVAEASQSRLAPLFDLAVAAGVGRELWDEPSEQWVEVPDAVREGGGARFVALTVAGDSMQPLLHPGDVILVRLGAELASDAVVVARHPERGYVVKQVGRLEPDAVELVSLNAAYDPIRIPRDDALILGTVLLRWCTHDVTGRGRRTAGESPA